MTARVGKSNLHAVDSYYLRKDLREADRTFRGILNGVGFGLILIVAGALLKALWS